jgi:multiple sugar transport system permease protein
VFSPPFTFSNYILLPKKAPVWAWTYNSAIVAVVVTAGTLFMSSLAAFALSKIDFIGSKIMLIVIASGLMIPIEAIVVPLYLTVVDLGWLNTHISLIVPSLAAPLGVIIMKQFYDSIPRELMESARIDGSSNFRTWLSICVPLSRSALAAVGIISFTNSWNNFLWPFLSITRSRMMTLPVGLPVFQGLNVEEFTLPMAACAFSSIPVLIVYLLFQKQIIRGIAMSGIKG